jgi:hypothetical protein
MGCEKCNISKNPTYKKCMNCWKKNDSIEDEFRVLSVDTARYTLPTINYNYRYTTTTVGTTSTWDDEDWYITTTGYTR